METPSLLEADLTRLLKDIPWGSLDMSTRITVYFNTLLKRFGLAAVLSFTSLADLGIEATDFLPTAAKLTELQTLSVADRSALYSRAWTAANGHPPPPGHGFKNLLFDITLEGVHNLRRD